MIEQYMIDDMDHEREMLVWFLAQKSCIPIRHDLWNASNDVVTWLMEPKVTDYPHLCSRTAEVSATAWAYIHGYLPPRGERKGAA